MTSGMFKTHRNIWIALLIAIPILLFFSVKGLSIDKESITDPTENVQITNPEE